MSFKVISGGPEGAQAPGQTPIPGIEKEFPLIEIVKPQNPTVKPLEMELLEEEPVVFEMASEEDLKKQETDEVLKNIIIAAQPLLERAKGLGMDTSQISAKMREGVGLYSKGELEKAHSLLKDIVGSIVMESVLFTQNKLESVLKKKPDEKTLPRYFAEAGVQFKKKDYPKTFDYLKYVVDQSTKIEKDIEDAQAKAAKAKEEEMSWEGDDIIGITVLEEEDAEDDDDTPVVCAVTVDEEPAGKDVKVLKPISKKPDAAPKAPAKKTVKGKKHVAHSAKLPSKNVVGKAEAAAAPKVSVVKAPQAMLTPEPAQKTASAPAPKPAEQAPQPKTAPVPAPKNAPAEKTPAKPALKVKKKKAPVKPAPAAIPDAPDAPAQKKPATAPPGVPKPTVQKGPDAPVQAPQPPPKAPDLKLKALLKAQEAVEVVSKKKAQGADVKKAEDLLAQARGHMSGGEYAKMIELSQQAIDLLK